MEYKLTDFTVGVASEKHYNYAEEICDEMERSAKARGTGIAKRSPDYIRLKMKEGKAIIAIHKADGVFAGFCYIESWGHERFVANSGLIVAPQYRAAGLATVIKHHAFHLSRKKFPEAKIFGLTTSLAVMKINSDLGYRPVTFSELPTDDDFWKGCGSCVNHDVLTRTSRKNCLCTGMVFDPKRDKKKVKIKVNLTTEEEKNSRFAERLLPLKRKMEESVMVFIKGMIKQQKKQGAM